jgi:hypothetical protein
MLGPDYRPVNEPDLPPRPPLFPERVRNVIYAFAEIAQQEEVAKVGATQQAQMQQVG